MKNFTSWFKGIKGKLLLSAMVPFVGFIFSGYISLNGTAKISSLLESSQEAIIPTLVTVGKLRESRAIFGFRTLAAIGDIKQGKDPQEHLKISLEAITAYKKSFKSYTETPFMPEEEKMYQQVKGAYPKLIAHMEKVYSLIESRELEKVAEAETLLQEESIKLGRIVGKYTEAVLTMYTERAEKEGQIGAQTQASVNMWIAIVIGASTVIALFLSIWSASNISKTVSSIAERLGVSSSSVTTSVEQLTQAGNSLSQSSTEAAASLEETVASLEEMSSMVQLNSDNAKQAAALSASSRDAAEKGQQEIESLIQAMTGISQSSKKIEEIISVIDDIAFQTNLLALNASVEAARAGEQGKGFAVVADAVRALAQRSADAAKDINTLIKDSVVKVEHGGRIAGQSGTVLNNIVTSVKKVADLNNEIASASAEQTTGIQQISKAMNQLDQASQTNAASAEEIAATSGEINQLAMTSQNLTLELNAVIHGTGVKFDSAMEKPKASPVAAKASKEKSAKVVPLRPSTPSAKKVNPAKTQAQEMIPFDDDVDPRAKVGTTDGF